jgi:hypothetical protein
MPIRILKPVKESVAFSFFSGYELFIFKSRFLKIKRIVINRTQIRIHIFILVIDSHKSVPVTREIQSPGLSVSYLRLTIVLTIPKIFNGIPNPDKINAI